MLDLSRQDRQQLRRALTSSFRKYSSLKIFVSDHFDDVRLNEIASSWALKDAADDLIEYFEEMGRVPDLILALYDERPQNPEAQSLMTRLREWIEQYLQLDPPQLDETEYPVELPGAYDDIQLEAFLPKAFSYEADVGKLRRGLECANAVCRVSFRDRPTMGTGVLVAPDLILTNYHVLSQQVVPLEQLAERAKTSVFEFGFVSQVPETPSSYETFSVDAANPLLACSPPGELDYALLRVESVIATASNIQPIQSPSDLPPLAPHSGLSVLQHPQGNVMQVSLSASGVVQTDPQRGRVWYVNRTQGGSSGSPCFNEEWELVALHHASVSRGFGSVREGILMSSIWAEISGLIE